MIVVRFRRANGLGATYRIEDDAQLQKVMDLANRYFGDPNRVLPDPLVAIAQAKARKNKRGNHRGKN